MKVKCAVSDKTFVTHWTLVGTIIGMYPRMLIKVPYWWKRKPHLWHRHGFSPVCVLTWLSKFVRVVKTFSHTQHMRTSPVCNLVSWFKCNLHLNILPHRPQFCSNSTVCKVSFFSRLHFWMKCWPQREHWYCFSAVCIIKCILKL